jgi:hypothetical protein
MKLSKNLSLAEVTKSNTANRLGIDNTPDEWEVENLKAIAEEVFQPLRDTFKTPILTQMYSEAAQTVRSSAGYLTILRLINSFGSLVIQTILIGCTLAMSAMVLIVEGASRLAETKRARYIMNRFLEKDSNEGRRL